MTGVGQTLAGHAGSASAADRCRRGRARRVFDPARRAGLGRHRSGRRSPPSHRRVGRVRRHLRVHEDVGAPRPLRERRRRARHRGHRIAVQPAADRRVRLRRDAAEVRWRRAAAVLLRRRARARGRRRGVRDAQHAAPDRDRRHRGRHGHAAHDRRRPQRAVRLLPRRRFAPGAHRRGPDRERGGGDRRRGAHRSDRHRTRDGRRAARPANVGTPTGPGFAPARHDRRASARRGRARRRRPRPVPARARRAPRGAGWARGPVGAPPGDGRVPALHRVGRTRRPVAGRGGGEPRRAGPHRPGSDRSARRLFPRDRCRCRRRQDHPHRGRAGRFRRERRADAARAPGDRRAAAVAPAADRRERGARVRRRHRHHLPPELHGDGRRGEPRRAGDGPRPARAAPRDRVGARQLPHLVRDRRARAVLRQGQTPAGHGLLGRARAGCTRRSGGRGTSARRSRRRSRARRARSSTG